MTSKKQNQYIYFLLFTMLFLSACGKSQTINSLDQSSRVSAESSTSTNNALASCNQQVSANGNFKVSVSAYKENGVARNDLLLLKFDKVPSDWTTSQEYFQFFRWQANTSSSLYLDPSALNLKLLKSEDGSVIINSKASISWSDISITAAQMGFANNPTEFFKKVVFVIDLKDPQAAFDALMISRYGVSNTSLEVANLLIPLFDADPSVYSIDKGQTRHSSLQAIHPFKDKRGQGWTNQDFQTWANNLCTSF